MLSRGGGWRHNNKKNKKNGDKEQDQQQTGNSNEKKSRQRGSRGSSLGGGGGGGGVRKHRGGRVGGYNDGHDHHHDDDEGQLVEGYGKVDSAPSLSEWQSYRAEEVLGGDGAGAGDGYHDQSDVKVVVLHRDRLHDILAEAPWGFLSSLSPAQVSLHLPDNLGRWSRTNQNPSKKKVGEQQQQQEVLPFPLGPAPHLKRTNPQTRRRERVYCHAKTKELRFESQLPPPPPPPAGDGGAGGVAAADGDDVAAAAAAVAGRPSSWKRVRDRAYAEVVLRLCPALFLALYRHVVEGSAAAEGTEKQCNGGGRARLFRDVDAAAEEVGSGGFRCRLHGPCLALDPAAATAGAMEDRGLHIADGSRGRIDPVVYYGRVRLCSLRLLSALVRSYRQGRYQRLTLEQLLCWDGGSLRCLSSSDSPRRFCVRHVAFESRVASRSREDCPGFVVRGCAVVEKQGGGTDDGFCAAVGDDDDVDSCWMVQRQECRHDPPCLRITEALSVPAPGRDEAQRSPGTPADALNTSFDDGPSLMTLSPSFDVNESNKLGGGDGLELLVAGTAAAAREGTCMANSAVAAAENEKNVLFDHPNASASTTGGCHPQRPQLDRRNSSKRLKRSTSKTRRGGRRPGHNKQRSALSLEPHHHPHDYYYEEDGCPRPSRAHQLNRSTRKSFLPDMDGTDEVFAPSRGQDENCYRKDRNLIASCYSSAYSRYSSRSVVSNATSCATGRSRPKDFAENHRAYYQHSSGVRGIAGGQFWLRNVVSGNVTQPVPRRVAPSSPTPPAAAVDELSLLVQHHRPERGCRAPPPSPSSEFVDDDAGAVASSNATSATKPEVKRRCLPEKSSAFEAIPKAAVQEFQLHHP